MSRSAGAQPKEPLSFRMPARLRKLVSHPAQVEEVAALPQLDVLWHYECVVRPHSHAKLQIPAAIPHFPAAKLQEANFPASSPYRNHSHAAMSPPVSSPPVSASSRAASSSSSLVFQAHDHRKQALQRVFNTFDENGDGTVSIHEISRFFEKLGTIEYSMESLLASLVTKSEGHLDEQEFLALYESICCVDVRSASSSSLEADVDQDVLAAFHVFDKDGNGFISPAELQSVLCSLGFPQGRQLEACVDMIARVDENGDGLVDFSEFKKLLYSQILLC